MNKKRLSACCFFIASAGFFLAAMGEFSHGNSMAYVWFLLAVLQLISGCIHYSKYKEECREAENQKQMDAFHKNKKRK